MAKAALKEKPEVDSKEVAEFIGVIQPPDTITPETRMAIVAIMTAFLESIQEREAKAEVMVNEALTDSRLAKLTDKKTKAIVVRTQEEADLAGTLANVLAEVDTVAAGLCEKETAFFNKFHKRLTGPRGDRSKKLKAKIAEIKNAAAVWLKKEMARISELEQKSEEAPVLPKPQIEGLSGRKVQRYRITDLRALVKAVARNKAPLEAIMINDSWLQKDVDLNHDKAVEIDGKKYLYDGVEVFTDIEMARR